MSSAERASRRRWSGPLGSAGACAGLSFQGAARERYLDSGLLIPAGHHQDSVWQACHRLADAARAWWPDLDGIVYRSRTTPATSADVAFWSIEGLASHTRELHTCTDELDDLVLHHRFTVDFDY